ncbi:MAG: hypothetical protein ABEH77_10165 [Halobacteriaceae archaeon]
MAETDTEPIREAAGEVAAHLREDGLVVVPRREVNSRVREHGDLAEIRQDAIRDGFEDADWAYDRHLYLDPDAVEERARELAAGYRGGGRLVVAREELAEELAGPVDRGDEAGWESGQFVGILRRVFEAQGWHVERVERGGSKRTLFFDPLAERIADNHPNGRPPLSTDDLFRLYVARSLADTV